MNRSDWDIEKKDRPNSLQESDGAGSSRRIMAVFSAPLGLMASLILGIALIQTQAESPWAYAFAAMPFVASLVYSLFLFGMINATNLKEIAAAASGNSVEKNH
jgi:hypothetical protein